MSEFQARIYEEHSPDARAVQLTVEPGQLLIDGQPVVFDDLCLEIAGHNEDRIKILNKRSGAAIICMDHKLLDALHDADAGGRFKEHTASVKRQVKSVAVNKFTYWWKVLAVIAVICGAGYLSIDPIVEAAVAKIDPSVEKNLGKLLIAKEKYDTTSEQYRRIEKIGKRLAAAVKDSPYEFIFFVDNNKEVNAYAYPGGYMIVNSGLIENSESDDEIAGVMSHEIGHVIHRDALRGTLHNAGVLVCIGILAGVGGDYSKYIGDTLEVGRYLERQSYGRGAEAKADDVGVELAAKAGYSGEGMITFFQRLEKNALVKDSPLLALISDHPLNADRIAAMRKQLAKLKVEHPEWFKRKAVDSSPEPVEEQVAEQKRFKLKGKTEHAESR